MMAGDGNPGQAAEEKTPGFEDDLKKLEEIVRRLEEGNLPLDESLRLYEEGIGAYQRCHRLLEEADVKVRKLVQTLEGELEEEPFEPPQE